MKRVWIDMSGTLIHHETGWVLPRMPEFLHALVENGYEVSILSRYSVESCRYYLRRAGMHVRLPVLTSEGSSKGAVIAGMLGDDDDDDDAVFIDDKPDNLESVKHHCGDRVRVIGFVGSHLYTQEITGWCRSRHVELAQSVMELCNMLQIRLDRRTGQMPLNIDRVRMEGGRSL